MSISPTLMLSSLQQSQQASKSSNSVLGKDDFLKLMVAQLKAQDPLKPTDNTQFISQMATFTSLEQTQNMNDTLTKFVDTQTGAVLGNQASMIGKSITWTPGTDSTSSSSDPTTASQSGVVTAVSFKNNQVSYVVGNTTVDPATITEVNSGGSGVAPATDSSGGGTL